MNFPIHMDDLDLLVAELRKEGFDARVDIFNGQVGLIVGPSGVDPTRLPPDTAGLFVPLWELNYAGNRPLVEQSRFHDIVGGRPADWQLNRPYQDKIEHERINLRHWNRTATSLGDKELEVALLQQVLIRHYPPSTYPVNIDVVGQQSATHALVTVRNFAKGIDESETAVPEDSLDLGGMTSAVLVAVD
jgi:hypothetical protein